jgi:hypothetical protein
MVARPNVRGRQLGRVGLALVLSAGVVACALGARGAGGVLDGAVAPSAPFGEASPPMTPAPPSPNVRLVITVVPSKAKATVSWGKKRLGIVAPHAPLVVQRPRDSGPLDLIVKSDGYVPVQTRAYTFADGKLAVKLTPVEEKNTLLGYREELPPPEPDGGVPSAPPEPDAGAPR